MRILRLPLRRTVVVGLAGAALWVGLFASCSSLAGDSEADRSTAPPPGEAAVREGRVEVLEIGESLTTQEARTTVTAVRLPFGTPARAPRGGGRQWLGVRAETCATDTATETGWYLFAAHGPDAERYPASPWEHPDWPRPLYPQRTLDPGECVEGWVGIPVVDAAPVATVRLSSPHGIPLGEWRLPEEATG